MPAQIVFSQLTFPGTVYILASLEALENYTLLQKELHAEIDKFLMELESVIQKPGNQTNKIEQFIEAKQENHSQLAKKHLKLLMSISKLSTVLCNKITNFIINSTHYH